MKHICLLSLFISFVNNIFCQTSSKYFFVDPFKEQEIVFSISSDSSFSMRDSTGCNQFTMIGKLHKDTVSGKMIFIFDSVITKDVLSPVYTDLILNINSGDTAWLFNSERLFIKKSAFSICPRKCPNLQQIRYKKLESFYIDLLGEKGFVELFGDGDWKKAKRRLLECNLPDINVILK